MPLPQLFAQSLRQFRTRRLESLLIVTAIALGVGVVTAVAAFLGINREAERRFEATLPAREITLIAAENDFRGFYASGTDPLPAREIGSIDDEPVVFTIDDLTAAKAASPSVDYAYLNGFQSFDHDALSEEFLVAAAVTGEYQRAANLRVIAGSLLSQSDFEEQRQVMLVIPQVAEELGLGENPVGKQVSFERGGAYTIVGLLPEPETPGEMAIVPWEPRPFGIDRLHFAVEDADDLEQAVAELTAFTRSRWGERVSVSSALRDNDAFQSAQVVRSLLIALFASIGLVVAALNIMTLMLARVLRRQREIGVTRTIGASRLLVRRQFLSESLTLGLFGGLLGVAAGYALLSTYNSYLNAATGGQALEIAFSWPAILVGLALALIISLLFGIYPAQVAANVRITEALKEY